MNLPKACKQPNVGEATVKPAVPGACTHRHYESTPSAEGTLADKMVGVGGEGERECRREVKWVDVSPPSGQSKPTSER